MVGWGTTFTVRLPVNPEIGNGRVRKVPIKLD